jgi:hypothetical protein
MNRRIAPAIALLLALALPVPAFAGWGIVDLEIGAKGGAGGTLWTKPTNQPAYLGNQDWAFSQRRGGWSGTGGLYVQLRLLKCLGIEVDALIEENRIRETPLSGSTWELTAKAITLHVPVLIQGLLPLPGVRIGIVAGPEFVFPVSTSALQSTPPLNYTAYPFKVDSKFATYLTVGLNITPTIGHLSIPVDLRASYNLTQSSKYEDRVTWNSVADLTKGFTIHYQDTWDFRLLIGLGYSF